MGRLLDPSLILVQSSYFTNRDTAAVPGGGGVLFKATSMTELGWDLGPPDCRPSTFHCPLA